MFVRVWEYEVPADRDDAFVATYGADGDWARLFSRGSGWLGTELFRSTADDHRFVTVDRWVDETSWRAFLRTWQQEYDALDARLSGFAVVERDLLGRTT